MKPSYLLSLAVVLAPVYAAVDPGLLTLVMPDASAIAGVQVEQGQTSPFGRFLLAQIQNNNSNSARDKLIATTGFDPLKDLREVLVASSGQKNGVVLGRGYFQPDRIAAAANQAGALAIKYKGVDILTGAGASGALASGASQGLAFLDSSLVAIGDVAAIEGVIDRRASGPGYSGDLAQKARDIANSNDAWAVSNAPANLAPAGSVNPQMKFLQTIKQFSAGTRFGSTAITFTAQATTSSAQDAQALADALRFLVSMIPADPKTAPFLNTARFSASGNVTTISLDIPEDQAESLVASATHTNPRPAVRQQQRQQLRRN